MGSRNKKTDTTKKTGYKYLDPKISVVESNRYA